MKSYSRIIVLIALIMTAGTALCIRITASYNARSVNTVILNDIVQTAKENWNDKSALDSQNFPLDMILFDSADSFYYTNMADNTDAPSAYAEAVNKGYICIPVTDNCRYLGTAVISDPHKIRYDMLRRKLIGASGAILLSSLFSLIIYGSFVRRNIITPFRKMEDFASRIAAGDLDLPLNTEKENMFGSFTASFDIMREELKASQEREKALKIKEKELVASLSHDLKTPITGIKLICELLAVKVKDEYTAEKINTIHTNAEKVNILISDLLVSVLDDLGEMNVICHDEPSSVLHELIAENDSGSLTREGEIPECIINIDKIRLSQIIGNIISNSYKYANTPIDVSYTINDDFLEMTIRDYGIGIESSEEELITQKFYRGSSGRSSGKEGSGLGLYIAKQLMLQMDGELVCRSMNKGLSVTLSIPLS